MFWDFYHYHKMNIGEKILLGNPEDIKSLKVFELNDVYEIGPSEMYFEILNYDLLPTSRDKPGYRDFYFKKLMICGT